jgi:hypothetical protein
MPPYTSFDSEHGVDFFENLVVLDIMGGLYLYG